MACSCRCSRFRGFRISCAVKLIRPDLLGEKNREKATERFRLEARSIARLSSPNTVRLYDFGVSDTGSFYFVMELLTGMYECVGVLSI